MNPYNKKYKYYWRQLYKMIKLQVQTKIYPTEDSQRISTLLHTIYPFSEFNISEPDEKGIQTITGIAEGAASLQYLFQQVRQQRTVEAVRRHVLYRIDLNHNKVTFLIHKQALVKHRIVLCQDPRESPLGPISITITSEKIEALIDYLFPATEKGKVLEVDYSIDNF